ncbi:unnamed protein product [Didymodactylos carnosus]|uniref:Uncharacterized protein n=2 Tax=Didymodactylos carnosus TaxID=1234261 RepID=A0A814VP58_9BILA|nr:unnamed protein product [Didymodactylos carnosus]CAF3954624.1 unnamed protein product [Didymodactylos carnosus]
MTTVKSLKKPPGSVDKADSQVVEIEQPKPPTPSSPPNPVREAFVAPFVKTQMQRYSLRKEPVHPRPIGRKIRPPRTIIQKPSIVNIRVLRIKKPMRLQRRTALAERDSKLERDSDSEMETINLRQLPLKADPPIGTIKQVTQQLLVIAENEEPLLATPKPDHEAKLVQSISLKQPPPKPVLPMTTIKEVKQAPKILEKPIAVINPVTEQRSPTQSPTPSPPPKPDPKPDPKPTTQINTDIGHLPETP